MPSHKSGCRAPIIAASCYHRLYAIAIMPQLVGQLPTPRAQARGCLTAPGAQQLFTRRQGAAHAALQPGQWHYRQQRTGGCKRRRRWCPPAAQQADATAAGGEQAAEGYSDALAASRSELGAHVVRQLASERVVRADSTPPASLAWPSLVSPSLPNLCNWPLCSAACFQASCSGILSTVGWPQ